MSIVDDTTGWWIDRVAFARNRWKSAIDSEDRQIIGQAVASVTSADDPFAKMSPDEQMRQARTVGWIYADIKLFAESFSSASLSVLRYEDERLLPIRNHPLEILLRHPNDKFDLTFLWQYTIKWLMLSRTGAFWFLAPERGSEDALAEIWPLPSNKVKPIPDPETMIRGYQYTFNSGQSVMIDPRYIVHYRFPDPFSLLQSDVPLSAALLAMQTEIGTGKYQKDTYVSGRGMPRAIVSVPEETSPRDFTALAAQIREEFEQEQKLIITRAGDIKSTTIGFTQREMELIAQRKFTRDEIDVIFLGFALHASTSEAELRQIYRMFKDEVIHPAHRLVAGQLTVQLLNRFYEPENHVVEFEDIRAQDRALNVQERNVYFRVKKLDEARADLGLPLYGDESLGNLLVPLATDPAYVAMLNGISRTGAVPGDKGGLQPQSQRRQASPNAAMSQSDAPVNQLSDLAKSHKVAALKEGMKSELRRWQKVAIKEAREGRNPGVYAFKSEALPPDLVYWVRGNLLDCDKTEAGVKSIFESVPLEKYELAPDSNSEARQLIEALHLAYQ